MKGRRKASKVNKKKVILLLIVFLFIGITWVFLYGNQSSAGKKIISAASNIGLDLEYDAAPTSPKKPLEEGKQDLSADSSESSSGSSGGGGGSGSGGGSSGDDNSEENCPSARISYSLKDFQEEITCTAGSSPNCTSISASCSIEVYHLDTSSVGGTFDLLYELQDSSGVTIDQTTVSNYVTFNEFELFQANLDYANASGVDESSTCTFTITSAPTKKVCS